MVNNSDWRSTQLPSPVEAPQGKQPPQPALKIEPRKPKRRWRWLWAVLAVFLLLAVAAAGSYMWYQDALRPVDGTSKKERRIKIEQGETVATISEKLKREGIIKDALAFQLYTQLSQSKAALQAGAYIFKPSQSVQTIVEHMIEGKVDSMLVTILPGASIFEIQKSLQKDYGFSPQEVEEAFTAHYNHPLLAGKPKNATLEGYIFPETYKLEGNDTVKSLFERSFDEMYTYIQENSLEVGFKKRKLTLFQGITLASIIQKEVTSNADMRQVAQIFYKRLGQGMELGADSTFIYGAEVLGVEPRVTLDSPYNTREVKGLPPGPISSVSAAALEAAAHPAKGDYLFFVSGDDGTTHFSRTLQEHEAKTRQYCRQNCAIFNN